MNDTLDYVALQNLIEHQGWWFQPAELHGILTGLIAGGHGEAWPALLFAQSEPDALAKRTMAALLNHIDNALATNDLRFNLTLPEDADAGVRAEALTFWVQGFNIATNWLREQQQIRLDQDCHEFIDDLKAMSELDTDLPNSEENHRLLAELEEHCRMGALMIYAYTHTPGKP